MFQEFHYELNEDYRNCGVPPATSEEVITVTKAITTTIGNICRKKRNYRLGAGILMSYYNVRNQCDYYGPNRDHKTYSTLSQDPFLDSLTEFDHVSKTFLDGARKITVRYDKTLYQPNTCE